MRRIPSSTLWRTLSYIDSLEGPARDEYLADMSEAAFDAVAPSLRLKPMDPDKYGPGAPEPASARVYRLAHSQPAVWSAFPDRFVRQLAADEGTLTSILGAERGSRAAACPPPVIAKGGAVKKAIGERFKRRFGSKMERDGEGWFVKGDLDGVGFTLGLHYGGKLPGIRYGIGFDAADGLTRGGLPVECSYGFGQWAWDFALADELEQVAETMFEAVTDAVQLYSALVSDR